MNLKKQIILIIATSLITLNTILLVGNFLKSGNNHLAETAIDIIRTKNTAFGLNTVVLYSTTGKVQNIVTYSEAQVIQAVSIADQTLLSQIKILFFF